jgi:Uma2 family endonuclease
MVALITDPLLEKQLIAQRQAAGADKHDEVWEGEYVMSAMADDSHQGLVSDLTTVLTIAVHWAGLGRVRPGLIVSDREEDWQFNYRCPDVVVFLKDTQAKNCGTHWVGGPDFAIEVVSKNDRTLEKLPFYASVGTRELLVIDRQPLSLTLYRLQNEELAEAGQSTHDDPANLISEIVPLSWQIVTEQGELVVSIRHQDGVQQWLVPSAAQP